MNSPLDDIKWNDAGLVQAIAQDASTGTILMVAWMNAEALRETLETNKAVYFSRSRQKLWRKGEESGHQQLVKEVRLDCDGDALLLSVEQIGGIACHTGRYNCFYRVYNGQHWETSDAVLKDPAEIYS